MRNALIMGAAGRDFHNFNTFFPQQPGHPGESFYRHTDSRYRGPQVSKELAGPSYPHGIPIHPETELLDLIKKLNIEDVYFAYSDVPHTYVMDKASDVMKAGANFILLGPNETMIKSKKPVVSVCAVRTGAGKSQTTRKVSEILRAMGYKVAAIRHPMPYGDLVKRRCRSSPHPPTFRRRMHLGRWKSTSPTSKRRDRFCRRRLTRPSCAKREDRRHHPLGRRQQRLPLLQVRPGDRRSRPAPPARNGIFTPERSTQRADVIFINKIDNGRPG